MLLTRPRVLFLAPRFPYPMDRGDRLTAFHMLRVFAQRYDVTLATYAVDAEAERGGNEIFRTWNLRVLTVPLPVPGRLLRLGTALLSGEPLQVAYFDDPGMRRQLRRMAVQEPPFEAVVCQLIRMAPFVADIPAARRIVFLSDSITLALARRRAHAPLLERPSIWLEADRVRRYEAGVMESFDEGWLVSEEDVRSFPGPHEKLAVVRLGVEESLHGGELREETEPVIGFLGHLGVPHNVDAACFLVERILPLLRARGIDARVRLYGAAPAKRVAALAQHDGVELVGFTADLRGALQSLRVFCAPLRFSSGVQNKLLEALAAGTPVVTSPEAATAIGPEAHEWVRVAQDAEGYASAIASLWSPQARHALDLAAARQWVRANFRWENFADRLQAVMDAESAADAPRRATG